MQINNWSLFPEAQGVAEYPIEILLKKKENLQTETHLFSINLPRLSSNHHRRDKVCL